jgi:hypothetical protein
VWNGNLEWYGIATSGFVTPVKAFQITFSGVVATSTVCVPPSVSATPSITPSVTPSVTPTKTPSVSISRTPSITPSFTPSPTPAVFYSYFVNYTQNNGSSTSTPACNDATTGTSIWSLRSSIESIVNGDVFYSSPNLEATWGGSLEWYGIATSGFVTPAKAFQISSFGVVATSTVCAPPTPSTSISATPSTTPPNTPPVTPTSTPSLSLTPTPSISFSPSPSVSGPGCGPVDLGYDINNRNTACTKANLADTILLYSSPQDLATSTILYRTSCGSALRAAGFYSNGVIVRYWNGSSFGIQFDCIE